MNLAQLFSIYIGTHQLCFVTSETNEILTAVTFKRLSTARWLRSLWFNERICGENFNKTHRNKCVLTVQVNNYILVELKL